MTLFPDVDQSSGAYVRELERHIDDAQRLAICEVLWSGTRQYQQVIDRDGLPAIQRLLSDIAAKIAAADKRYPELVAIEADARALIASTREDVKRLGEPDFRRDCVTGRLVPIDVSGRVTARIRAACAAENQIAAAKSENLRLSVEGWRAAELRLRAAILLYVTERNKRPARKSDAEPLQVVMAPDTQFRVVVDSLPSRQTVSEISRNTDGEIVSTVQVESDLPGEKDA